MKAGRAHALLNGRTYLTHEDVQSIALPVLGHRLIMRPESEMDGRTVEMVVQQIIQSVPVLKDSKP
jgi:MoxR-like ATPase